MIDYQARVEAIRDGKTVQRPEVDAIGLVLGEVLRPVTLEPFPLPVIDALRAIDAAARRRAEHPAR